MAYDEEDLPARCSTSQRPYRPPRPQLARQNSIKSLLVHVDFFGIFLFAGSIAALITGLNWGGSADHPWSSAGVVAPLVVGCVGLVIFGFYEAFVKKDGLFDTRLFKSATYPVSLSRVCGIAHGIDGS